ncbi:MAG: DoxX family membrane protein [Desulfitobacterium hafniense]|nr:DoxX family membrane protein [Desulfitobacterium hafniense]
MRNFTIDQLSSFNGTNNKPSYVGYKGKVYDVSGVFQNGEHGGLKAGTDITSVFANGPHSEEIFAKFPAVGVLNEANNTVKKLLAANSQRADLILRLAIGIIFLAHGSQKLLGWFGGYGWSGTMGFLTGTLHIPSVLAGLVILIEFFGGLAIIFGFLTRLAALGIAGTMVGAAATVHLAKGFFLENGGVEYVFILLAVSVYLMIKGSGAFSVDALISRK